MGNKFKVGDRVVVLEDDAQCAAVKKGDSAKIINVLEHGSYVIVPDNWRGPSDLDEDQRHWRLGDSFLEAEATYYSKENLSLTRVEVKFKKLTPEAVLPTYAKDGDAGMDLTVIDNGIDVWPTDAPGQAYYYREYKTGLAVEIPPGYVGLIFPRSSQSKTSIILANCVGVIDSGYRGEITFRFKVDGMANVIKGAVRGKAYGKGDRAGQLIIMPYPQIKVVEAEELSSTDRGDSGFGSTGA